MSEEVQIWIVYGIVALTAFLLLRRLRRRQQACENCPIHEISRHRQKADEPIGHPVVGDEQRTGSADVDRIKGDD